MARVATEVRRSGCPIANTLDLVGDRWTMVILRDMVNGKTKYGEFLDSPEHITTNILAERLRRMEAAGLIEKRAYQTRPTRHEYLTTRMGDDFLPVLQAICRWANRHIPETWVPPAAFMTRRRPSGV